MTVISNQTPQKTHAFAVSPGSHALRTYPDDAGAALATSGPTLRGYAARNPGVRWRLWGHLKMRGFMRDADTNSVNSRVSSGELTPKKKSAWVPRHSESRYSRKKRQQRLLLR